MWFAVRVIGIAVGVASLLRLATLTGVVEFQPWFQSWMDWLREFVELGFLVDVVEKLIVQPALEGIRSTGLQLPNLQPHWQPIFVLSWLLAGAAIKSEPAPASGSTAFAFFVGFVCALLGAIGAGLSPPGSLAVLVWWLFGMGLLGGIDNVIAGKAKFWNTAGELATIAIGAIMFASISANLTTSPDAEVWKPLWIVVVAAFVAFIGFTGLWGGLTSPGSIRQRLRSPDVDAGLTILGTMGGALGVALVMADPPLW